MSSTIAHSGPVHAAWSRGVWTTLLVTALLAVLAGAGPLDSAWAEEPEDPVGVAIEEAAQHLDAGRTAQAVAVLEEALASAEDDGRVAAALGDALVRHGEPYRALQYLQAAVDAGSGGGAHIRLAEALLSIARQNASGASPRWIEVVPYLEDALASAARAEGDASLDARRLALVGEAHHRKGEPEAALEALVALAALPAGSLAPEEMARLADMEARSLYALRRFAEAAAAFTRAGNPRGAASAYAAAQMGADAVAIYATLLRGDPGNETLLADALAAARYTGATTELAGALADLDAEGPAKARVLVTRGLLSESGGALEAAERLFKTAVDADPTAPRPLYELGRIRLLTAEGRASRLDAAIQALTGALERAPGDADLVALLWDIAGRDYARAWLDPRALDRTIRIQQALVAADPEDGLALANLGNTLRIAGRHEEAIAAYDRAREAEPGDAGIASDRGLALSAAGRTDEALAAFEAAVLLDPEYDAAHQNAARFLWRSGRDEEAAAHLALAEIRTRDRGGDWMRYRFLMDRVYRTRARPEVR